MAERGLFWALHLPLFLTKWTAACLWNKLPAMGARRHDLYIQTKQELSKAAGCGPTLRPRLHIWLSVAECVKTHPLFYITLGLPTYPSLWAAYFALDKPHFSLCPQETPPLELLTRLTRLRALSCIPPAQPLLFQTVLPLPFLPPTLELSPASSLTLGNWSPLKQVDKDLSRPELSFSKETTQGLSQCSSPHPLPDSLRTEEPFNVCVFSAKVPCLD